MDLNHLGALVAVLILLAGAGVVVKQSRGSALLLWVSFAAYVIAGLTLSYGNAPIVAWVVRLTGNGSILGAIAAVAIVAAGWQSVMLAISMIRDVMDKRPDEEARKAALWVPTLMPLGGQAVWGVVTNPRGGAVNTIATAAIALVTVIYTQRVSKAALGARPGGAGPALGGGPKPAGLGVPGAPAAAGAAGRPGAGRGTRVFWHFVAAAACLLGGIVAIGPVVYGDATLAGWVPQYINGIRLIAGVSGFALLIAATVDMKDRIPDKYMRAFLAYGIPLLALAGAGAIAAITGIVGGAPILQGALQ